jgi:hypothetical protein
MRLYDSADGKYSATPAMLMMDWLDCKRRKRAVTNWSAFVLKFQKFPCKFTVFRFLALSICHIRIILPLL